MVIVSSATERDLGLMTNEEALTILKQPDRVGYNFIKGNSIKDVQYNIDSQTALAMAIQALESQKQAHWIYEPGKIPKCSNCHNYSDDADKAGGAGWCPFCGAKMTEDINES